MATENDPMATENDPMATERMTLPEHVRKVLESGDADLLREGMLALVEAVMEVEVSRVTGAARGERAPDTRITSLKGHRDRRWDTRVGTLDLQIPRVRDGSYSAVGRPIRCYLRTRPAFPPARSPPPPIRTPGVNGPLRRHPRGRAARGCAQGSRAHRPRALHPLPPPGHPGSAPDHPIRS
jgi:hypothetical protein